MCVYFKEIIQLYARIEFVRMCSINVLKQIKRIGESRSLAPDGLYFRLSCLYSKAKDPAFVFPSTNHEIVNTDNDDNFLIEYIGANNKNVLIWKLKSLLKSSPCHPTLRW